VITPDSAELGAASGQLRITDAERPSAHHTVSVDMAPFWVPIRVAYRTRSSSYEKIRPRDHLFFAAGARDRAKSQNSRAASAAHPFNRSKSFPKNNRSVAAIQDAAWLPSLLSSRDMTPASLRSSGQGHTKSSVAGEVGLG
jgi:hypothetical protein